MADWKSIVKNIAPTLGTALGGPMAGAAVKVLADGLLGNKDGTPANLERQLEKHITNAAPDQLIKLRELDQVFQIQMEKLGVDVFRIEAQEKDSARKYNKDSYMPAVLSISLTVLIGILLWALFYIEPPEGAKEILFMLLGIVVREWANAMHYWFGTTKSSSDKTQMLKGTAA